MTESLPVDGQSLTLEQFLAVVREGCPVSLAPGARGRLETSRGSVERAVAKGRPVYGVTTGFGSLSDKTIPRDAARELQVSLLRSHASGTGPPIPEEVVRGMLILRANSLSRGYSGVRTGLVDLLLELLNQHLVPFVPEQGSVGASGDLAPLAHLGIALMGEGEFLRPDGGREKGAEVLARHRIAPWTPGEKEGVALINGTSLMGSYLALSVADLEELLQAAEVVAAISFDALRGNPESLDPRLGELKNQPEQQSAARALGALLNGSELSTSRAEYTGQDPYTLRCMPQVFAAVALAIRFGRSVAETELNAVSDNPVVFEGDEFVSGGNFHGQSLALALDTLALAAQYLAAFSERRIARILNPALNRGLPAFLAPKPGLSSGFMIGQYLAAALVNENITLSHPASVASLSTSADQEDFVSMGAWAGSKLRRMVANAQKVLAVEAMVAAQALELRRPMHGGKGTEAALRAIRQEVGPWSTDR